MVNYPNDYAYTRVTEFKYLTGQEHAKTSVVYEFPQAEGDPYYPIPRAGKQRALQTLPGTGRPDAGRAFCGAAGFIPYYNMDQVVGAALTLYKKIGGERSSGTRGETAIPSANGASVARP